MELDTERVYRVFDQELQEPMLFVYLGEELTWAYIFVNSGEVCGDFIKPEDVIDTIERNRE